MREGPTRRPHARRWPLDGLLKGVGTLRVLRELYRPGGGSAGDPVRAWDVALWSGVTPQGAAGILERLCEAGIVEVAIRPGRGRAAEYRLTRNHPWHDAFDHLFRVERTARRLQRDPPAP